MRRGLVHVLAWLLATGAAVTLSWWGVHTVMAGTAYDPPRALPVKAADAATREPKALATPPERTPPPKRRQPSTPPASTAGRPSPAPTPSPSTAPAASGRVKSYDTDGGRAVFDLGKTSASLVSATPGAGWSMQVWKTESWIRVDFAAGSDRVSVFCTWHDSAPRVDVQNF
jgi:hypothetical protein